MNGGRLENGVNKKEGNGGEVFFFFFLENKKKARKEVGHVRKFLI